MVPTFKGKTQKPKSEPIQKNKFSGKGKCVTSAYAAGAPAYKDKDVYVTKKGDYLGDDAKKVLGGKGAGIAEMISLGLPVPAAAIISTEKCKEHYENRGDNEKIANLFKELGKQVNDAIVELEKKTGAKFFNPKPGDKLLLLSVRSGAEVSMPGMMETVLNIGLNWERAEQMIKDGEDPHFVNDCLRRLLQSYGSVVLEVGGEKDESGRSRHEGVLASAKLLGDVKTDAELKAKELEFVAGAFNAIIKIKGKSMPQDPFEQVMGAVEAVFRSAYGKRALDYKRENKIPLEMPTAVTIQAMVYGNRNDKSGSGVLFTRDNNTGENVIYSDFLQNAQGEEVVSGVRTPITFMGSTNCPLDKKIADELFTIAKNLEKHYEDMLDIEYTVDNGKLYILQVRSGKRTGAATFKIIRDLEKEGLITKEEGIMRITNDNVLSVLLPQIDPSTKKGLKPDAKGVAASAGAASGMIVFDASEAERIVNEAKSKGLKPPALILVKQMTEAEDYSGMVAAREGGGGVLTAVGGPTSHAAVVCKGNRIPAVVGCGGLRLDIQNKRVSIGGKEVKEGDFITIDGTSGEVYVGELKLVPPELTSEFNEVLGWTSGISQLRIKANADTPKQAREAREFRAEGIGLCRTEHMFQDEKRIKIVQKMFLAKTPEERQECLDMLLPMQQDDFEGIFKEMSSLPVTIRLLDPPMHEFLPDLVELEKEKAAGKQIDNELLETVKTLHEQNPMLGVRGVRLLLQYPEIMDMQVKAIINAALKVKEDNYEPVVQIMVPVVAFESEFVEARKRIDDVAKKTMEEYNLKQQKDVKLKYKVGTMIEIPSACLSAGEIAKHADFFSFGTNDLTQTTLGLSRDDTAALIAGYIVKGFLKEDPFVTLHPAVAKLVKMTVEAAREANPDIEIGICGEQGVDPESIGRYLHGLVDYGSGTAGRVLSARVKAAQATIAGIRN